MKGLATLLVIVVASAATGLSCASASDKNEGAPGIPPRNRDAGTTGGDGGANDSGNLSAFPIEQDSSTVSSGDECDPTKPFGTPALLFSDPNLKSATPRLSHDELTIYFTSDNATTSTDLFRAVRPSRAAAFGTPATMTTQSSASNDNDPAPSADHLSLFFHTGRGGNNDLWVATRGSTAADFGMPSAVPVVNDATVGDSHPYYRSSGGGELYFTSVRNASATYHVYVAKKNIAGFLTPTLVQELSGAWNDWQPMVTEDGLTMLFASDRPTAGSGFHLWIANRATDGDAWGTPQKISELEAPAPATDFAGWISADRCRIYFSSGRDSTIHRAYFASRPR
jgi:hypothetical protein